jgi:hypothetical protein
VTMKRGFCNPDTDFLVNLILGSELTSRCRYFVCPNRSYASIFTSTERENMGVTLKNDSFVSV